MKPPKSPFVLAAFIIVFLGGSIVGRLTANRPAAGAPAQGATVSLPERASALPQTLLPDVPDVRQSTNYSCGASALQAVLAHWGIAEREDRLMKRLRSTPEQGTSPDAIVRVAREFGLEAALREGLGLDDLASALKTGMTVIVDLQAWRESEDKPWAETWEDGHYMVLLGMDGQNLYFEDPSLLGSRGFIPRPEFLDRWHDYEGDPPLDAKDRTYVHAAIFLQGRRPASLAPLERVK
jgi:predicted double-glycine peptidase